MKLVGPKDITMIFELQGKIYEVRDGCVQVPAELVPFVPHNLWGYGFARDEEVKTQLQCIEVDE